MGQQLFRCRHCKKLRPKRGPEQRYCGSQACQKARNNAWRRSKRATDPDYRVNQQASTQAWLASQGGSAAYYRGYRKRRQLQTRPAGSSQDAQERARTLTTVASAKSNAKVSQRRVKSGTYRLVPCRGAKSNAILVQLSIIAGS